MTPTPSPDPSGGLSPEWAERFKKYHADNPRVYELFRRFAAQVKAAGHSRYSADALLHRIRWHTTVETTGVVADGFKIANAYAAHYARLLIAADPSFAGFFILRPGRRDAA